MASRRLRVVVDSLDAFVNRLVKGIILDIVANLVAAPSEGGTPIDTGWASANWVPEIGAPSTQLVGTRESVSTAQQGAALAQIAASYRIEQGAVFISNGVRYILKLNEGSSRQVRAGFVQRAIAKAVGPDVVRNLGG